ncbi:MAG: HlyD family efflux transporter periplasmic adaptor subunit [Phycisphaerae bacterium]
MSIHRTQAPQQASQPQAASIADVVDELVRFDGPPEQFLARLLAVQCAISGASAGAFFRVGKEGRAEVLAAYPSLPQGAPAPPWLVLAGQSLEQVASSGTTVIRPLRMPDELYGAPADKFLVLLPLKAGQGIRGFAVFLVHTTDGEVLQASRQRLELTLSLLALYEMRLTLQHRQFDLQRLRAAMEVLAAVNEPERFTGVGMALVNELCARWQCDRVGLGFLKGRYVHLKALSHTEKFSRKMRLVQLVEAAMEECLDQDVEVVFPAEEGATCVSRAAGELSRAMGPACVLSLPLRRGGEVIGALTLERPPDKPFGVDEIEAVRLTCDLCTARLANLHEHDRWFGARAAGATRKALATFVGPKHAWLKVGAIAVFGAILFLVFARGDYQAEGPCVIEATSKQIIPMPYDGYLKEVNRDVIDNNTKVEANKTVLATLKTEDYEKDLAEAEARFKSYDIQARAALSQATAGDKAKLAEYQVATAQAQAVRANINRLKDEIRRATITSPIDGVVVNMNNHDLTKQINAPFKQGDMLFEVCPLEAIRAEISVPEDEIADVQAKINRGEEVTGELATAARPDVRFRFTVERINPMAELVNQKNVFRVRVAFDPKDLSGDYRPMLGSEGVARIDIDKRNYGWLWTRRLVNWVRMKLWI